MRRGIAVISSLLVATAGAADTPRPTLVEIPEACDDFAHRPVDEHDLHGWTNLVSLATCMQRASVPAIDDLLTVQAKVEQLAGELAPSMILYVAALEHAPTRVQLRAAYHIGITSLALVTRARSAIAVPELADDEAMWRFRILHARVETALAPAFETARVSFALVVQLADADRSLAEDPVQRHMIRHAIELRALLVEPEAPTQLVQHPGRDLAPPARL